MRPPRSGYQIARLPLSLSFSNHLANSPLRIQIRNNSPRVHLHPPLLQRHKRHRRNIRRTLPLARDVLHRKRYLRLGLLHLPVHSPSLRPRRTIQRPIQLRRPYNYAGTCLLRHLSQTKWDIEFVKMTLNNTLSPATTAMVSFLVNTKQLRAGPSDSNGVSVPLVLGTNHTNGIKWMECHATEENSTAPCRFQFDTASGRFTLNLFT